MSSLQEVLRRYGKQYLQQRKTPVPEGQRKVLNVLPMCRTPDLGRCWYYCPACGSTHALPRSCGNRHCATCQQDRSQIWLQRQMKKLLPCEYFLVTFTLPGELRNLAAAHQEVVYGAVMQASAESMKDLAADPRHLGSRELGFFGVLQTWGRTLQYHPHVHYVVPGGVVSPCGTRWRSCPAGFFLPEKPLARLFRGKFRAALQAAGFANQCDSEVWNKDWVVDVQPAGNGVGALKYLAAYVFRVAISDRRIESCEGGEVRFRYTPSGKRREATMQLDALKFVHRFLQHVLPQGFHKVRHHGFLHPNSRHAIEAVRWLIYLSRGENFYLQAGEQDQPITRPRGLRCVTCGGPLQWLYFERATWEPPELPTCSNGWQEPSQARGPPLTSDSAAFSTRVEA